MCRVNKIHPLHIFSAKESIFKAIFGNVKRYVGFREVEVEVYATGFRCKSTHVGLDQSITSCIEGYLYADEDFVLTYAILRI